MPFVTTKLVLDIATGKILHIDGYEYTGPVELACGASDEERSLERSQHYLFKQIIQDFQVQFGKQNNILDSLTSIMTPIAQPLLANGGHFPSLDELLDIYDRSQGRSQSGHERLIDQIFQASIEWRKQVKLGRVELKE
jgi:hypothetical protein